MNAPAAPVLFADGSLARRIERAEADLVTAASQRPGERLADGPAFVRAIGGGVAVYAGTRSPLTKVCGAGFGGDPTDDELEALEAAFEQRQAPVRFEISTLADPALATRLTRRGYGLVGFENVLGRRLPPACPDPPASDVTIRSAGPDDLDAWLEVLATGFANPDDRGVPSDESFPREVLEGTLRDFARADGMTTYLAFRSGEPAGGASMRTAGGVALLCGAATLPAHRRRGVQAALLTHRLRDAAEGGCDIAVVTTQPGSTSQQNVQRKGFELLYARAVLVREPGGGSWGAQSS